MNGWISVADRLPRSNVHVLCCTNWGEIVIASYQKWRWSGCKTIVYWQPLPKIPQALKTKLKNEVGYTVRERDPNEP